MDAKTLCGVDLGATKITASIAAREGFLARTYKEVELEGEPNTVPNQVISLIDECCRECGIRRGDISDLGISSAGPFRKTGGGIELVTPNMCGGLAKDGRLPNDWTSIPLEVVLKKEFPKLKIGNDAVTGAAAERTFGNGRGYDDMVYVTWSTGIGTGAYVDGRLIGGKNGNAPHGGHVFLVDGGPTCGCGDHGHLEAMCAGPALAREFGEGKTPSDLFDAYRHSEEKAREIVEQAARQFARGLATINAVLDTKRFIIGGSVFMNNIEILLPLVRFEFKKNFPALTDGVEIVPSGLGEHLGAMAALSLVMPKEWVEDWVEKEPWKNAPEMKVL